MTEQNQEVNANGKEPCSPTELPEGDDQSKAYPIVLRHIGPP